MYIPVKDEWNDGILAVVKVEPLMEYQREEDPNPPKQQVHKKLGPLWSVIVSVEHPEMDYEPENCEVRIGSPGDPGIEVGPIRFGGLAFRTWNMNGKKGLSITAESWTQDSRPSAKRPPAPPTPAPSQGEEGKKAA